MDADVEVRPRNPQFADDKVLRVTTQLFRYELIYHTKHIAMGPND